tara:strand:- start:9884 stop:10108 length:225 start_codon:yes stop_codon:yes gene_type:complete
MRTLTWDRGTEIAQHKQITLATKVDVYFCDPQSPPWQIPSQSPAGQCVATWYERNTNRLLRQYFPKKTNLAAHS